MIKDPLFMLYRTLYNRLMPRKGYLSYTYYYSPEAAAVLNRMAKSEWKGFLDSLVVKAGQRANADQAGTNPPKKHNTRGRTNESRQKDT